MLLIAAYAVFLQPAVGAAEAGQAEAATLTATSDAHHIDVAVNGKRFVSYTFAPGQKYPYFFPVNGPISGKSVTTESSEPYPHHHSLFFGCDKVNGGNYWQDNNGRGQIVSQGPTIVEASGGRVVFTDVCLWKQPGQEPVLRDHRRVCITAPATTLRLIDFEITLEPLTDVRIEKTNHSLFSARVVPELSVKSGGTLVNAEGNREEKGTWGVPSPWCDYYGTRDGVVTPRDGAVTPRDGVVTPRDGAVTPGDGAVTPGDGHTEGIAILQHPGNRWFPAKWFTRDYGFFSPTPMYWPEAGYYDFPKGEKLTLRYRVVVHAGDTEAAGVAALFEEYQAETMRP